MGKMFFASDATYREVEARMRRDGDGVYYDIPEMPSWIGIRVFWPFGGAAARVAFYERANPENGVSTYLDVCEQLGYTNGKPYFEIYPDEDDDNRRFLIDEQPEMYPAIIRALEKKRGSA